MDDAIKLAITKYGTRDVDLRYDRLVHGMTWRFGEEATITLLSGFSDLPKDWDVGYGVGTREYKSRRRNAISLVLKVEYHGKSILIAGDSVGRFDGRGSPSNSPAIATDKYLLDRYTDGELKADILIAPHHGSDNGSSVAFIREVNPGIVVFSAEADHGHPKQSVGDRYNSTLRPDPLILTTDFGDTDEGKGGFATGNCKDKTGDDGISFLIRERGGKWVIDHKQDRSKSCR